MTKMIPFTTKKLHYCEICGVYRGVLIFIHLLHYQTYTKPFSSPGTSPRICVAAVSHCHTHKLDQFIPPLQRCNRKPASTFISSCCLGCVSLCVTGALIQFCRHPCSRLPSIVSPCTRPKHSRARAHSSFYRSVSLSLNLS